MAVKASRSPRLRASTYGQLLATPFEALSGPYCNRRKFGSLKVVCGRFRCLGRDTVVDPPLGGEFQQHDGGRWWGVA